MIKGINATGRYLTVTGGTASTPYINSYSGSQAIGIGNMRYNPTSSNTEVWDGNTWMSMGTSYASIQLDPEAVDLLDWAKKKRNEELEYEQLAKEHPAVAAALENLQKARQQLIVTAKLSKDETQSQVQYHPV